MRAHLLSCVACRAEKSYTHRHLCEFTGLDFEMEIKEHYFEVLDVIDALFRHIFEGLTHSFGALQMNTRSRTPITRLRSTSVRPT